MARPASWRSPTTAIRVPEHAVSAVLALARSLDAGDRGFVQNPATLITVDETPYLLQPQPLTPEEQIQVDRAADRFLNSIEEKDLPLAIALLTERILTPI